VLPALALFTVFLVVPMVVMVTTSFSNWSPQGIDSWGFSNFARLVNEEAFWRSIQNTMFYAAAALLVQVPLAVFVSLLLARRFPGWKMLRSVLFLPNMMSGAALGLVWAFALNPRFGLVNEILRAFGAESLTRDWFFDVDTAILAVTATWVFSIGLYVVLITTDIFSLSSDYFEAAELDGASRWQRELFITLPLVRPVMGTCSLLAVLGAVSIFDPVYVTTRGGPADATTSLTLFSYLSYSNGAWGEANAVGLIVVLIGVSLVLLIRRLSKVEETSR